MPQKEKTEGRTGPAQNHVMGATDLLESTSAEFGTILDLLNTLINNIPDSVYVKDMDGRFLLVNPPMTALPDRSVADVVGKTDYDFMPKDEADACRAAELEIFRTGRPIINLEEAPDPLRGRSGWRLITKVPFRDADGNIAGLVGINRDITEIRAGELALKSKEEELLRAQKMEALGRLAGGIAHDLNNILAIVFCYSEAASNKARAGAPNANEIEAIMRAARRAGELTDRLLSFGRKQFLALATIDLNALIDGMREALTEIVGDSTDLDIQLAPELFRIRGDKVQLEQVIMQLALNARDAMPNGGKLSILTEIIEITESDPPTASELKPGPCVLLSVVDTGCGMTEQTLSRIFEPFFTTKDRHSGSGMGLSTSYGTVQQCGGHITARSAEGEGTAFQIYFPILPEPGMEAGKTTAPATVPDGAPTILVAEDNEAVLRVVAWALEREGYVVAKARTGTEALARYGQNPDGIALIITDVVMPNMDGVALIDHVRALRPDAKLLCISGYLDREEIELAIARTGIPALQKPFAPQTLVDRVREALAK